MRLPLLSIQPSQLYINSVKLAAVEAVPGFPEGIDPVPVKELDGQVIFTDGHTRALALYRAGIAEIPAIWDTDELDWEAYRICVDWCREAGINTIAELQERLLFPKEYKRLWLERCRVMQLALEETRRQR